MWNGGNAYSLSSTASMMRTLLEVAEGKTQISSQQNHVNALDELAPGLREAGVILGDHMCQKIA